MPFFEVKADKSAGPLRRALHIQVKLDNSAGPLRRALQYALYDWTQDMPWSMRLLTSIGIFIQLGALTLLLTWSRSAWMEPKKVTALVLIFLLYLFGLCLMSGTLTSQFVRKAQLEADQLAAQQIQQTLQPQKLDQPPGYQVEFFFHPLRTVAGDYFDIVDLPGRQTLFALADVSGKGIPAALLAANIQAPIRSISAAGGEPVSLASQINAHLCRYTPPDRFATAIFALLSLETGEVTYVSAGHNPPILLSPGSTTFLESTGMPLGIAREAEFGSGKFRMPAGAKLLVFTDGLPDGIGGQDPEKRICGTLAGDPSDGMQALKALLDPQFNQDDVTVLLLTRLTGQESGPVSGTS
jgi:Stage II sporulation protein E (SpoIIE)